MNEPTPPQTRPIDPPTSAASTGELVRDALAQARTLMQLEIELARDEVRRDFRAAKTSLVVFGIGSALVVLGLATLLTMAVVAIGPVAGAILGAALCIVGATASVTAYRMLPKNPLGTTRQRLETDVQRLKERVA